METDILNPTSTDELNPDYGLARKRPPTHAEAKAIGGPPYMREVTDMMQVYTLSWGSDISNSKMHADMKRLKWFYEQFRDGYFTIIDYEDTSTDSGLPRHRVGRFLDPVEPVCAGNLWWQAVGIRFIEIPDVPMVQYPDDWSGDSIWRFTLNDFGELQPSVDDPGNWTLVQDPYSAMSVRYGSTKGYDLQSVGGCDSGGGGGPM